MDGILLVNKPAGITSFDAVRQCRRIYHEKKTGHTGTLDPGAEGLMIILMGKYTKLIPYCVKNQKHYIAEFMFGIRTDTEDIWGTEILKKEPSFHTDEELKRTADSFVGETDQVPPMYSALKKNGRPLYSYAREGIEIERKARRITVDSLTVSRIGENRFCMDAVVSEGTYIRSLIRDFADALGEEAAMTSLKRTAIEHIKVEDAHAPDELTEKDLIHDPLRVISRRFPVIQTEEEKKVRSGMDITLPCDSDIVILVSPVGELLAAYRKTGKNRYHCERGLF